MKTFFVLFVLAIMAIPIGFDVYNYNLAQHEFQQMKGKTISYFVGNNPALVNADKIWDKYGYYYNQDGLYNRLAKKATKTVVCLGSDYMVSYIFVPGYDRPIQKVISLDWEQKFYNPVFAIKDQSVVLQRWELNRNVIYMPVGMLIVLIVAIPLGIIEGNAIWGFATTLTD